MSPLLRLGALLVFLGALGLWIAGGSHRGWTQTSVVEFHIDEITEIEFPVRRDAFVPGVEFPIGGSIAALTLLVLSFVYGRQSRG